MDLGSNLAVAGRVLENRVSMSSLSFFLSGCFLPFLSLFFFKIFRYEVYCGRTRFSRRMVNGSKIVKMDQKWLETGFS